MMFRVKFICAVISFFLVAACALADAEEGDHDHHVPVPRITVEELKSKLERGEEVYILDLRSQHSYTTSRYRISGDIRIPPRELRLKAAALPRNAEIVTYCT